MRTSLLGITIAEAFSRYVVHTIEMEYKLKMTDQDKTRMSPKRQSIKKASCSNIGILLITVFPQLSKVLWPMDMDSFLNKGIKHEPSPTALAYRARRKKPPTDFAFSQSDSIPPSSKWGLGGTPRFTSSNAYNHLRSKPGFSKEMLALTAVPPVPRVEQKVGWNGGFTSILWRTMNVVRFLPGSISGEGRRVVNSTWWLWNTQGNATSKNRVARKNKKASMRITIFTRLIWFLGFSFWFFVVGYLVVFLFYNYASLWFDCPLLYLPCEGNPLFRASPSFIFIFLKCSTRKAGAIVQLSFI